MTKRDVLVMYPPRPKSMAQLDAAYNLHRLDEAEDKDAFLAEYGPICEAVVTNGHFSLTREHLRHLPKVGVVPVPRPGMRPSMTSP